MDSVISSVTIITVEKLTYSRFDWYRQKWKGVVKARVLERRFLCPIKQIGKVASVHSIQPLSAFDNSYIQKMIC